MNCVLSAIAGGFLDLLGWRKELPEDFLTQIHKNPKLVLVYPHTTYWDFVIAMAYYLHHKHLLNRDDLYTLVKPQPFRYFGWLLKRLNCIPSTRLETRSTGSTQRVAQVLRDLDRFVFLISPKGKRTKGEWRHGYYYIAQLTEAQIVPVGLDYAEHRVKCGYPVYGSVDNTQLELQRQLSRCSPLHPDRSEISLYYDRSTSVMSTQRYESLLSLFVFVMCTCVSSKTLYRSLRSVS